MFDVVLFILAMNFYGELMYFPRDEIMNYLYVAHNCIYIIFTYTLNAAVLYLSYIAIINIDRC